MHTLGPGEPAPLPDVTGAVLAGGRSSRFGSDKSVALIGGTPLLLRVLASLEGAGRRYVVRLRDGNGPLPPLPGGVEVAHDLLPGGGPLSGLHAALSLAPTPWVAVAACDLPCLTPAYWALLRSRAGGAEARAVVVAHPDGRLEPLAALYHRDALPLVERRLRDGDLPLQPLVDRLTPVRVPAAEVRAACGDAVLHNINRPGDVPEAGPPCAGAPGPEGGRVRDGAGR